MRGSNFRSFNTTPKCRLRYLEAPVLTVSRGAVGHSYLLTAGTISGIMYDDGSYPRELLAVCASLDNFGRSALFVVRRVTRVVRAQGASGSRKQEDLTNTCVGRSLGKRRPAVVDKMFVIRQSNLTKNDSKPYLYHKNLVVYGERRLSGAG